MARAGTRCMRCDPVVRIVTYGRRGIDPYQRVVEVRKLVDGKLDVNVYVWPWGYVEAFDVQVGIG